MQLEADTRQFRAIVNHGGWSFGLVSLILLPISIIAGSLALNQCGLVCAFIAVIMCWEWWAVMGLALYPHADLCDALLPASIGHVSLGAGQLLSAVTASPPPPGASSRSAAPPSAAGPVAVGATELDHFDAEHNASLQWGTWRPGEYFGLRSRTAPDALAAGLMWTARAADGGGGGGLRHSCKEGELGHYAYTAHDGRSYAAQEITDAGNGIALRTEFARPPSNDGWAVRIEGRAPDGSKGKAAPQLVFFYVAVDAAHAEECRAGTDAYIRHAAAQIFRN